MVEKCDRRHGVTLFHERAAVMEEQCGGRHDIGGRQRDHDTSEPRTELASQLAPRRSEEDAPVMMLRRTSSKSTALAHAVETVSGVASLSGRACREVLRRGCH
eukprot:267924-Heterocapsa_arctica.AAC.1